MGHLINPIAMRIGWFRSWEDIWYVKYLYYPEYLHSILKIRAFLTFMFTNRKLEHKGSLLYSHFDIIKQGRLLNIFIYAYYGALESFIFDFFFDNWKLFKDRKFTRTIKVVSDHLFRRKFRLFILFCFFFKHQLKNWPRKHMHNFISLLSYDKLDYIKELINSRYFLIKRRKRLKKKFLLFYYLYIYISNLINNNNFQYEEVNVRLLTLFIWSNYMFSFFNLLRNLLVYLISFFSFISPININFFLISNDSINAKFLARFLARKLQLNFRVRELVNPIKRELRGVAGGLLVDPSFSLLGDAEASIFRKEKKIIFGGILKYLFNLFFKYYWLMLNLYYFTYFSFISFNDFFIFMLLKVRLKGAKLIGFAKNYFLAKPFFSLFFNIESSLSSIFFENILDSFYIFNYSFNFSFFFERVYESIFFSYNAIFFWYSNLFFDNKLFFVSSTLFNQYITYNYISISFKYFYILIILINLK